MRKLLRALLAFFVGAVAGYGATIGIYAWMSSYGMTDNREGAAAMGVLFMVGPAVALVCGLAASIWAVRAAK